MREKIEDIRETICERLNEVIFQGEYDFLSWLASQLADILRHA